MIHIIICSTALLLLILAHVSSANIESIDDKWEKFVREHKKYYTNKAEETLRRSIWERNCQFIENHNGNASKTFKLGMNEFGDLVKDSLIYFIV